MHELYAPAVLPWPLNEVARLNDTVNPLDRQTAMAVLLEQCWSLAHVLHQAALDAETEARHLAASAEILENLLQSALALWRYGDAVPCAARVAKDHTAA